MLSSKRAKPNNEVWRTNEILRLSLPWSYHVLLAPVLPPASLFLLTAMPSILSLTAPHRCRYCSAAAPARASSALAAGSGSRGACRQACASPPSRPLSPSRPTCWGRGCCPTLGTAPDWGLPLHAALHSRLCRTGSLPPLPRTRTHESGVLPPHTRDRGRPEAVPGLGTSAGWKPPLHTALHWGPRQARSLPWTQDFTRLGAATGSCRTCGLGNPCTTGLVPDRWQRQSLQRPAFLVTAAHVAPLWTPPIPRLAALHAWNPRVH